MKIVKIIYLIGFLAIAMAACKKSEEAAEDEGASEHADHTAAQETASTASAPKSPRLAAMSNIGSNHVHIDYSAPSVRGRVVWGGLVAYDQVWVTGAHSATNINFNKPLKINGTEFEAGKYALFTIPGKDKWTIIINKNWDQHLADEYDISEDLLRIEVIPEALEESVEQLNYTVSSMGDNKGEISISWSDIKVRFPVESVE